MRWVLVLSLVGCGRVDFDRLADAGANADAQADATTVLANRAFVTSDMRTADFGGAAGGNAWCQQLATSAGLEGEFVALVYTSTQLSLTTLLSGSRGWVDVTGRPIARDPADFERGALFYPIDRDEAGRTVEAYVWLGPGCNDWTMRPSNMFIKDSSSAGALNFSGSGSLSCGGTAPIWCAERGRSLDVPLEPVTSGRVAFLSTTLLLPGAGGGAAMADQACATDAISAGLAGQFRAFIADAAGGPELRVPPGEPWHRVDGIPWATYDQLTATAPTLLDTVLTVRADGSLWTGSPTWVGTAASCALWTTTSGTGTAGNPGASQLSDVRDAPGVWTCTSSFPVICLQE